MLTGGVVAAVCGPAIAAWSADMMQPLPFAGSYAVVAVFGVLTMLVLAFAYREPASLAAGSAASDGLPARPLGEIVRQPLFLAAFANNGIGNAVMMFVMTATPIAAVACQHTLTQGAQIIEWHLVGMYAPSFFSGWLLQRFGNPAMLASGIALSALAAVVALCSTALPAFYLALLCLGIGWNFMFVGGTTLLAGSYRTAERAHPGDGGVFRRRADRAGHAGGGAGALSLGLAGRELAVLPALALALVITLRWQRHARRVGAMAGPGLIGTRPGMIGTRLSLKPLDSHAHRPPSHRRIAPRGGDRGAGPGAGADVTGPTAVFGAANKLCGRTEPFYDVRVVSVSDDAIVRTESGVRMLADAPYHQIADAIGQPIDTLLISGGSGHAAASDDARLIGWIREQAPRVRRLGASVTGAFVLARTGLLDEARVTTHWRHADRLATRYPRLTVDADPIWIRAGRYYTSAGVTAGMDLSLALVEEDLGYAVSLEVARELVLFASTGQPRRSSPPRCARRRRRAWNCGPCRDGWRITSTATSRWPCWPSRMAMSPRYRARVRQAGGETPARYVERCGWKRCGGCWRPAIAG